MKARSKAFKFFQATAWIMGIALLCIAVFAGTKFYTKAANEADQKRQQAQAKVDELEEKQKAAEQSEAEEAVPVATEPKEKVSFTSNLVKAEPSDEEKAIKEEYGEDAYLLADDKTEAEVSADVEYGRQALSQEIFDYYESQIPEEFCWNSLSVTSEGGPSHVISSAKDHGYVDYNITSALSTAFDSKKDDDEGIGKELIEEFSNPYFVSVLMRGIAPLHYVEGVRWGEMYEFIGKYIAEDRKAFAENEDEFWKMMEEDKVHWKDYSIVDTNFDNTPGLTYAEIPGKGGDGIDHWVLPAYDGEIYEVTPEYRSYAAKLAALIYTGDVISYEGISTRSTVLKSVVDNRVAFGFGPEQERAGFMRGKFTDLPSRQVTAPALIFAPRDKNGRISGDLFGIDYWDKNFEIYGSVVKESGGKKVIIQDDPVKTTAGSSEQAKLTRKSTTTTTTTTTTKKKYNKKKESSSVLKSENQIDGKNPVGQGTDALQSTKPAEAVPTVAEAQHQPTEQTQAIVNSGQKTTPGTENPVISGDSGEKRVTESGAEVVDSPRPTEEKPNNSWVEQESAQTTEIPVVKEDYKDNGSAGNNNGETDFSGEFW